MKIINSAVDEELDAGRLIKLELGCGQNARDGFYSVDILEIEGLDIVADLNEPLSLLPDNCCDEIYSMHAFEHVSNFLPLMRELHRIVKPGGKIEIIVPHFSNAYGFSDPTHVRFFGLYTMYYFVDVESQPALRKVPAFYSDLRFNVSSICIEFYQPRKFRFFMRWFSKWVNQSIKRPDFYELKLSGLIRARQIRYVLETGP